MENEENKDLVSLEANKFVYSAGDEAKDINGKDVNSSEFKFVQQDKSIHDVKFNTKPTTFMKDAMKRFTKNRSSVVGGIILGVLFVLALVLPSAMVNTDIKEIHNLETHLPMKLLPAGAGFWDGTIVSKNSDYPYELDEDGKDVLDENGNPIFTLSETYPDPSVILSVNNKRIDYQNHASSGASGGYAQLVFNSDSISPNDAFMYNSDYSGYDFDANDYKITFSLGKNAANDLLTPDYSLIIKTKNGRYFINGGFTSSYGEEGETKKGASIKGYSEITVDLNEALNDVYSYELIDDKNYDFVKKTDLNASQLKNQNIAFGFAAMKPKNAEISDKQYGFYIKSCRITGTKKDGSSLKASERLALNMRSFGTSSQDSETPRVSDANAMVLMEQTNKGVANLSYWTSKSAERFDAVDCLAIRADLTIDMYQYKYGLNNDLPLEQNKLEAWKKAGLVEYTSLDELVKNPNDFHVTDKGKESNEMFVNKITSITKGDNDIYTIKCQGWVYKYLGYSSIPIHIFGTDKDGKDMLKYVFSGLRTSLILGIIVSFINIIIGIIWGSISGYYGGVVDITMERITDILGGIPYIVLMTVLTIQLGTTFFVFALSLCLTGWIGTASTTRSQFYRYRGREYVLAAKTLGAKPPRLIFRHILPNAVGTIVTRSVLMIPSTIFSEATISYLGLGLKNLDSLGVILSNNQKFLSTNPSELIIPAIIISLLMICFNLFGNGLRDAFNPSLKGEE